MFAFPWFRSLSFRFGKKTVVEAVRVAVSAGATAAVGSPVVGSLLGTAAEDALTTMLAQASDVEKKIDHLVGEPLLSGLALLRQGTLHDADSVEDLAARDRLLEQAHVLLTRAGTFAADSREDSVFIGAFVCISCALHQNRGGLAQALLAELQDDIGGLRVQVEALEADAKEWETTSEMIDRFFNPGKWKDQPAGNPVADWWANKVRREAEEVQDRARGSRRRLDLLHEVVDLATRTVAQQKGGSGAMTRRDDEPGRDAPVQ
jgi:hypothetical protein